MGEFKRRIERGDVLFSYPDGTINTDGLIDLIEEMKKEFPKATWENARKYSKVDLPNGKRLNADEYIDVLQSLVQEWEKWFVKWLGDADET